ncbi:MAG: AI-2E family transporter [Pirellulales bacterium]|nr:AI-2E family transporter [Pirellulales bacterium]
MSRLVSFLILVALVAVSGLLFYQVMAQFLLPIFLAVVLVVIFRPLHRWVVQEVKGSNHLAALLTTLMILLVVLAPMVTVLAMAAADAARIVTNFDQREVLERYSKLLKSVGLDLDAKPILDEVDEQLLPLRTDDLERLKPAALTAALHQLGSDDVRKVVREVVARQRPAQPPVGDDAAPAESIQATYDLLLQTAAELEHLDPEQPEFVDKGKKVDNQFQDFTLELYGSSWVMWLKKTANPGPEELPQLRERLRAWVTPLALSTTQAVGGVVGRLIVGFCIMVVSLYFFLADGPGMVNTIMRLSPLAHTYEQQILFEFDRISRAVVVATLLSALVQAVLAAIGYYFAGLGSIFLLTVITFLLAMVPFVGAASVWGACALWLFLFQDDWVAAAALAAYGTLVISMADNIIKPYVLHGQSNLHPLLALLSVLGGVQALGPIGIFVGPMVVAFLQAALNMLRKELDVLDGEEPPPVPAD